MNPHHIQINKLKEKRKKLNLTTARFRITFISLAGNILIKLSLENRQQARYTIVQPNVKNKLQSDTKVQLC